jgi:hypothetical protein
MNAWVAVPAVPEWPVELEWPVWPDGSAQFRPPPSPVPAALLAASRLLIAEREVPPAAQRLRDDAPSGLRA